jgi:branched-chain amino acid transport system ATP-binding protein
MKRMMDQSDTSAVRATLSTMEATQPSGAPASQPVLSLRGLVKRYGGLTVTHDVDLDVMPGEVHALLGPNGAGKTTLLGQITGDVKPDAGRIEFDGQDITKLPVYKRAALGIGRSFQITSLFAELTVLENACLAVQAHAGHSFRFWQPVMDDAALVASGMRLLERVGLVDVAQRVAGEMSHGQHRQLEIAIALAGSPKLLLLDEPMAGMGTEDGARLTRLLLGMKGSVTILLVEHDMDAVFALADRISVLVYGRRIATGTTADIRENVEVRRAYLGDARP